MPYSELHAEFKIAAPRLAPAATSQDGKHRQIRRPPHELFLICSSA